MDEYGKMMDIEIVLIISREGKFGYYREIYIMHEDIFS